MKKHHLNLFFCLLVSTILFSCAKKGDTGPAGATGPQGTTGPQGPQGVAGNANVVVDTFTLKNSDYVNDTYWFPISSSSAEGWSAKSYTRSNNKVTDAILKNGMVLVYIRIINSLTNEWTSLPLTFLENNSRNYSFNYAVGTALNKVKLYYYFVQTGSVAPPNIYNATVTDMQVKILIVSGTVASNARQSSVDLSNYQAVAAWLNLKD
ncbi:collagen-like protein [Chitinophaga sp. Cy-1792]|uniref:collagen-like triple helix repeat-containing protein n=1 Tax=Chitinophaga sp. Cy-1792 TaxID=2608339 RepID=UPI00141DA990|nr:collagen-like protein [Chitinophaga sp. Cy-1792]NIG55200.1 collagen-like protein [Chitinophaga sp. Cy-1792]